MCTNRRKKESERGREGEKEGGGREGEEKGIGDLERGKRERERIYIFIFYTVLGNYEYLVLGHKIQS